MKPEFKTSKAEKIAKFDLSAPGIPEAGIFGLPFTTDEAEVVVIPMPWEVTVSYRAGTAQGPHTMLAASPQIDLFEPTIPDAWKLGIAMEPISREWMKKNDKLRKRAEKIIEALESGESQDSPKLRPIYEEINEECRALNTYVRTHAEKHLNDGKAVCVMGGEHSVALGLIQALSQKHPKFSILHIDAHADLRDAYEGFEFSHASIQFNAQKLPNVEKLVVVGIRDYSEMEDRLIANSGGLIEAYPDRTIKHRLYEGGTWKQITDEIVSKLGDKVYLSYDIDALDPALCPHTGTPVPGGLEFEQVHYLIEKVVSAGKTIIGFDLCEVAPHPEDDWDSVVGMRTLYRLCNLMAKSQKKF
jgi:agmatinase